MFAHTHTHLFLYKLKTAVTLAEVLIAIGIIGVIAAMTISPLLQKQQEKTTIVALKKAYSTISNAYTLAVQENGTPDAWQQSENTSKGAVEAILNNLAPYLNVTKNCGINIGCWPNIVYKTINNNSFANIDSGSIYAKAQLSDGSIIHILNDSLPSINCSKNYGSTQFLANSCALYRVDINGFEGPNIVGKDLFTFYLTKYGVVPEGTSKDTHFPFSICEDTASAGQGRGCAAWVIYNENMDYLNCSNLNWTTKRQCD